MSPLLILHVSAASIGLLSGATAVSVRKAGRLHRAFGTVFFLSMLTMTAAGAYLAVMQPARLSLVSAVLTFYLTATAWATVKRRGRAGLFEYGALLVAVGVAAAGLIFSVQAAHGPKGRLDGIPPAGYVIFASVAVLAAALDLRVILRGRISGVPRIARHLWRGCTALLIATASFFLGQQKVMPTSMHGSPLLVVPVIAVLGLLIFWQIRVRRTGWFRKAAVAS